MTGRLVIMGSGETTTTMSATHRETVAATAAREVVVLDTTFGFQENVEQLTARLVDYFETSVATAAAVASLRSRDAPPVVTERFRQTLRSARAVFAGPGSPSYALSVWTAHGVGPLLAGVIDRGGSVTLASAAALTAGAHTLPVYEIYKVGEDPRWLTGLDLLAVFGLSVAVVPHWNNAEGGNHDTSRCFIGERRLRLLEGELDGGIIGVDEHTAATFESDVLVVSGRGTVTLRGATERVIESGESIAIEEVRSALGGGRKAGPPSDTGAGDESFETALVSGNVDGVIASMLGVEAQINEDPALRAELRSMIVRLGDAAAQGLVDPRTVVGGFIDLLLELRRDARAARRFEESDRIRDGLADLGVEVRDTGDGDEWHIEPGSQNP